MNRFNKTELIKETDNFRLLRPVVEDYYVSYHDKDSNNYYVVSKQYGTVETGTDSIVMGLMYLHQAEMGYKDSLQLFNKEQKEEARTATH